MNNSIRSIARIDIKNDYVIKGIHLEGLRKVGNPKDFILKYYQDGINEIFLNDSVATLYGRNNLFELIKKISKFCFLPITLGGGIKNLSDVKEALNSGADRIYINSALVRNPELLNKIINIYGSSTIVAGVDCKQVNSNSWKVLIENGREETGLDVKDWINELCKYNVGEIMITSIDKEGTKKGFDYELIKMVNEITSVPFVISGGCGKLEHIFEVKNYNPNGIAFASVLHYNILDINDINSILI